MSEPKAPRKGGKVNVGVRTAADDQKAADEKVAAEIETGKELVEEDGARFIVERLPGMTIKTRI